MSFDQGLYWKKRGKTYIDEFDSMEQFQEDFFKIQEEDFIDIIHKIDICRY